MPMMTDEKGNGEIKMVYVFLANGFEEVEALVQVDMLRRCELEVKTVGIGGKFIRGAHGITVACDIEPTEMSDQDLQAIVLPGGMPGTLNLERSEDVQNMIRHCADHQILIGAICAAPSILGHMGLLHNKKAVCFPGFEGELTGAQVLDAPVVRDGNIITSKGAGTAFQFSFALAEALCSPARAEHLKAGVQWQE